MELPGEQCSPTVPLEEPAIVHGSWPGLTLQAFDISESTAASSAGVIALYFTSS